MLFDSNLIPVFGAADIWSSEPAAKATADRSDQRYRQVFENSSDALFIVNVEPGGMFSFDSVNPAAEHAFGLPGAVLNGLSFHEIVAGRLGAEFGTTLADNIASYLRCVFTGMPCEYEDTLDLLPERHGGRRQFHVRLLPLVGDRGIERIIGIAHDITLRKQYENELRERARLEDQLSALAATVPGFLFTFRATPDGHASFPFASPGVEELFGLRPEDIRDDAGALHARYHPDDRAHVLKLMEEATWWFAPFRLEVRAIHPAKGERWVEMRSTPQHRPDGATEWHGLMIDVTARKRAENECHRREQEFHTLAEHSPDVIMRFDRECRRLYVNPAYEAATGVPVASVLGSTLTEATALPKSLAHSFRAMLQKVIATGLAGEIEVAWRREGKGDVAHQIRAVPEFDESGRVVSVLSVARDISALKETQRQLMESRALLQELSARREEAREEERKRIARDLHEELGQVLTALRIRISTLPLEFRDASPGLRATCGAMLALVDRAIQGMRDVITSLRPTTLDAGIVVGLEWLACEFGRHVGVECNLKLPEDDVDLNEAQATGVFRIVQEALTNVARHANARRVDIVLEREGDDWCLLVRDDGRGFDPEIVTVRSFGLLGMSERAVMLGGEVDVFSPPEGGTVVRLRFRRR